MPSDSGSELQHPRRNLGNRCRSQAEKFVKLARKDPERMIENLQWGEQNARQAILHDFTDERNWHTLAHIKKLLGDGEGMYRVLNEVFTILGREAKNLEQLEQVNMLEVGVELLAASLTADPLDADHWWEIGQSGDMVGYLEDFAARCRHLDFRDQRANIIFGRRLERVLKSGRDDLFIELVQHLLAHRPGNHELWLELGRLHEKRSEWERAWLCYDHVQQLLPQSPVRDSFRERLIQRMDGEWKSPGLDTRNEFLLRMQVLAESASGEDTEPASEVGLGADGADSGIGLAKVNVDELELRDLLSTEDYAAAFFLARRLVATGEEWASSYLEQARSGLEIGDD